MEARVKQLWSSVLDRDEQNINGDADFFEIGGDSVTAIKLADAAEKKGLYLPAQMIFEHPTLKIMAQAVKEKDSAATGNGTSSADLTSGLDLIESWTIIRECLAQCNIPNDDVDYVVPCTPFQQELAKACHDHGAWMFQAVFEVGPNSLDRAKRTLSIIRDRVPTFRTRVVQQDTGYYQVVTRDPIDWEEFKGTVDACKRNELAKRMSYGENWSRYVIIYDESNTYILWTMSHALYDRFSKMSTLEDVHACFKDPETFAASPRRVAYGEFARFVKSQDEKQSVKYWTDQLKGLKSHELLFKDNRQREYLTSSHDTYRKTTKYTAPQGTKINWDTITQTAWSLLMSNISKADDIFYCTFRSCRHLSLSGIEGIIGPLWSMVPVRRKLDGKTTLKNLLQKTQNDRVSSMPHEAHGITALKEHFGHNRYLQCVLLPQPPQPDFGAAVKAHDEGGEYHIRSAEELWTQARGHYGLYIMLTPKQDSNLEIWARFDEHFISKERTVDIVSQYAEMLQKVASGDWEKTSVHDLCPHLTAQSKSSQPQANGSLVNGPSKPKTLTHLFTSQSDDPALIIPGEEDLSLSHSQLQKTIGELQKRLAELGVDKGSAVSIALPNSLELIAVFLAATWQRGIAAPLNPSYKQGEFEFYIDDLGSALVVVPKGAYEQDGPAIKAARNYNAAIAECYWHGEKVVLDVKDNGKLKEEKARESLEAEEDDIALVLHTSGTTGRPKAVPLTHKNLISNIGNICRTYELTPEDRTMLIMPLFHVHGLLASFLSPLYSGGSAIVPPRLEPTFWNIFNQHKANWYSATPSMHRLILQFPPPDPLPEVRFIRSCSSQLPPSLFHQLEETFKAPIVESYAMTEASHLMASNPLPPGEQKPGSVGLPQEVEMKLLDQDGNEVEHGKEGEVSVRGPNVTHGYLNNPDANKSSFTEQGFFRTGDQGKFDEDGFLILTGRLKEMINKGGEKISPVELDNTISQHESVAEVVCFAMDDEAYGQTVGCAVKFVEGKEMEERELKKWIGERISAFKVPQKIWVCESIPKTATGKVQRRLVAEAMLKG